MNMGYIAKADGLTMGEGGGGGGGGGGEHFCNVSEIAKSPYGYGVYC